MSRELLRVIFAIVAMAMLLVGLLIAAAPTRRISTALDIAAQPRRVWTVLTDLPAYPSWNPTITSLAGRLVPGATMENVEGSGEDRIVFRPRVLIVRSDRELEWRGRLFGLPFLFIGKHDFRLEPIPTGTRFVQSETFGGVLLWCFDVHTLLPGFAAMNARLAERAVAGEEQR